jgi:hypothetical protein
MISALKDFTFAAAVAALLAGCAGPQLTASQEMQKLVSVRAEMNTEADEIAKATAANDDWAAERHRAAFARVRSEYYDVQEDWLAASQREQDLVARNGSPAAPGL